jgi:hypothetical protein
MDIPTDLISAQTRIVDDLATVDADASELAITGRTKNIQKLASFRDLSSLWIAGLGPHQLKAITSLNRLQKLVIHDMRVADLRPLATMTALKTLVIWGNTKAESLAGLDLLRTLDTLALENFARVRSINPLAALTNLRVLCIEGSMHSAMVVETLKPLERLKGLRRLRLANVRVMDGSLAPVAELKRLERLFIANMFSVEEFARLAAALPHTEGETLAPFRETSIECDHCGAKKVLLAGEGQPALCSACDADRIATHVERFNSIKLQHLADHE